MSSHPSRRDLFRLAGAAAAVPILSSCAGAPATQATAPGTFTVYWNAGHDYQAYRTVIAEFEQANRVKVNLQKYQWPDLRTRLLADFAAGTVPDLVEEPGGWVQEFAVSGNARSLQDFVDRDGQAMGFPSDWQPVTVERNSYQGKVYGVQLHLTCNTLFYNKGMLAAAGVEPPTTWEEFLDAARKLTKDGVYGVALNQDFTYMWPWLVQAGVTPYDLQTKAVMEPRADAVAALQFQADLVHKHKVAPVPTAGTDYSGPQKLFSAKRAAMILTGPWDLDPIRKTSPDIELGVAPPLKNRTAATQAAGVSMFVPAKAARPELSWDFIKRVTTLQVEQAATKETGMLMPRKSWAELPEVQSDPITKVFADALPTAQDSSQQVRLTGQLGKWEEQLKVMYQQVLIQNQPAAEAMESFVKAAEGFLK
ncbi:N-Acetyl-D-glucosamine ABC transport system, sugar-binding protein [[Actinomadura] parvosata subsp. kistnae]|uniref:ABC transporter substrate-binding protein n=1 Tax=[Actinomadura] parvosata subsp. kistnae TaxID=1909395 RepID=A0A1V0A5J0_9ACTN|nr:extracellular solute-binding protein [Nonomuraea sp. ATCC 55076]AQZ65461.1 ABC transporter substrate-binding protein [Nonomuraea sp. ATCC 55076]SPL96802.1 N-Acetyl-D-glucosamine ABC transport system, sugar-binding protein [Actinomadura parvosata subsp. kistnae]